VRQLAIVEDVLAWTKINRALQKAYGTSSATPEQVRLPRYSPDVNLIERIVPSASEADRS
jgi:transposase